MKAKDGWLGHVHQVLQDLQQFSQERLRELLYFLIVLPDYALPLAAAMICGPIGFKWGPLNDTFTQRCFQWIFIGLAAWREMKIFRREERRPQVLRWSPKRINSMLVESWTFGTVATLYLWQIGISEVPRQMGDTLAPSIGNPAARFVVSAMWTYLLVTLVPKGGRAVAIAVFNWMAQNQPPEDGSADSTCCVPR